MNPIRTDAYRWHLNAMRERTIILVWLILVVPFTLFGYGSDGDAWLVAANAQRMWAQGEYIASRTTGFPLFEIAVTPAVHFGGWYLSNLVALIGGLSIMLAMFRLARIGHLKRPLLATIGLLFLPVIVKNSSVTMDYIPAVAAMLWGYVALIEGRLTLCGLLIGLACGFRPSSGLFVIPCAIFVLMDKRSLLAAIRLGAIAFVAGVIAYSPALLKYGVRSPMSDIVLDPKTLILIGGYNITQLFGIIATVALIVVFALALFRAHRNNRETLQTPLFALHATNILLWLALFTLIPEETEYLMPLVPSVILLMDYLLRERVAVGITALLLIQHVIAFDVLGGTSGDRHVDAGLRAGFTVADLQDRRFKLSTREAATEYRAAQPTVLMLGYAWIPSANDEWVWDSSYDLARQRDGKLFVTSPIRDEAVMKRMKQDGFRLVVWNNAKWQYTRTGNTVWTQYVEVVDDLDTFFGREIVGRPVH